MNAEMRVHTELMNQRRIYNSLGFVLLSGDAVIDTSVSKGTSEAESFEVSIRRS